MKKYYYFGAQRVAVRDGNGTGTTGLSWLLTDHLGSTTVTLDAAGAKNAEKRYKPWGEERFTFGTLPTQYTYTGQFSHTAQFGLLFYNARWYDPLLGRFNSPDTIIPEANPRTQAWDRFAGMANNPVRYNDPSGHMPIDGPCGRDGEDCNHIGSSDKWHNDKSYVPACEDSYDAYSACGTQNTGRSSDYLTLNIAGSKPILGLLVSIQIPITFDRFGNLYVGIGISLGPKAPAGFSGSFTWGGVIVPDSAFTTKDGVPSPPPGEKRSEEILSGGFVNGSLCFIECVGFTKSLSQPYTALDLGGIGLPQVSVGGGYSWLFDFTSNSGKPIWKP